MYLRSPTACLELDPAQSTEPNYSSLGGSCVRKCGPGSYSDTEMGSCEPCHRACETCTGLGHDECSSCPPGLQLLHGTCVGPTQAQTEGKFWNGMCLPRAIAGVRLPSRPPASLTLAFGIPRDEGRAVKQKLGMRIKTGSLR